MILKAQKRNSCMVFFQKFSFRRNIFLVKHLLNIGNHSFIQPLLEPKGQNIYKDLADNLNLINSGSKICFCTGFIGILKEKQHSTHDNPHFFS